jgi:hypothetical protein
MATHSSDPLTAAMTSILLPILQPNGFRRKTNRVLVRIRDDILQFFDLQLSAYGGKDFCVNYASLSLYCPRDYLILQPGDRLKQENGTEAWLSAATHDAANLSMHIVTRMTEAQAMVFFESTSSTEGLLAYLEKENWGSLHHLNLEKACCAAKLHHFPIAREYALQAIELYLKDGRSWCLEGIELCKQLLGEIENGSADALLAQWLDHSVGKLGLQKFL